MSEVAAILVAFILTAPILVLAIVVLYFMATDPDPYWGLTWDRDDFVGRYEDIALYHADHLDTLSEVYRGEIKEAD